MVVVVQLLNRVQLFVTPWTAAHQVSLFFTISQSMLILTPIESVIPSNHLILLPPSLFALNLSQHQGLFQWVRSFPMSRLFASGDHSIGASASVLPMNIQDWLPLELTGLTCLQFKGLSGVLSSTTIKSINPLVLSPLNGPTLTSIHGMYGKTLILTVWTFVSKVRSLFYFAV